MRINSSLSNKHRGFTLVEIIIGIVVLSISLAIVSTLIVPTEEQSADNLLQIKAAELGQSYLNDITSRAFDHNSDMAGGRIRCGEPNAIDNPCSVVLGPEPGETNRNLFNDVDDFHNYTSNSDAIDGGLDAGYRNFTVEVTVVYAGLELELADNNLAKKITVTVTTPLGTPIDFATYKTNF